MKYIIFASSLVSIVLSFVGLTLLGGIFTTFQCEEYLSTHNQSASQQCLSNMSTHATSAGALLVIVVGVSGLTALVAWILGLVTTIIHGRIGWFIATILLGPWAAFFYSAFGPDGSAIFDPLIALRGGRVNANNAPGFDTLPNSVQPGRCWQCGGQVKLDSRICLHCGATQTYMEARPSMAAQMSGFDQDNANGAFPPVPHPISAPSWSPPPPGYQQPGQPPAMPPGYPPPGYQQPGQPPAPGGSGWGPGYN